jgi:hypothetical protein
VKRVPNMFTMCPPIPAAARRKSPAAPREDAEDVDKDDEAKAPDPPTGLTR